MTSPHFSSGDLIADRRADYARMFAESGEFAEAAELMEQALEQVPSWAAGWFRLAEYAEKSGRKEAATAALQKVVALDPADIFGAGLKLAVLGAAETPAAPSTAYVERLFDDYADRFDTALVQRLDYTVPQTLARLVRRHAGEDAHFGLVSDIGCGTGLFGVELRASARRLEGFDLSAGMLAKAEEKGVYDHLAQADLSLPAAESGLFAAAPEERADLVGAADVLMYLGDLAEVFPSAARLLKAGGVFAFSVEDGGTGDAPLLRPSLRYAHPERFIRQRAEESGLAILAVEKSVIRQDAGQPVHGLLFLARREA
ncbi:MULTISPECIES: methyltransferase domain-containing protein [unclassified Shinella]|uniref:methyltransferase domain-containing protein n=1 Tax=unclassified Shinella TaxID=2643062 RepID=UPI00225CC070|nr:MULTISPECIES: methyltransferase domain-containing protein [unclassified Shinella]MCO5137055.1 methyltransferase domain-containing protein [Shinella sp.]MDC7253267.1 methyltransferase domain-containing protein [Shinella sp. YE25]CAI0340690.1 putative TPR repeat methyltransferase [Rhizobiaceae bacterium]CAK7259042.1 putative TPR repeat methyltransferase [Shinella sp. WSC3-e]